MNWTQASLVLDRFIRLVDGDLNELKQKHVLILQYEKERDYERATVEKSHSDRLINQIQTTLQQVLSIRSGLDDSTRCKFDARIEPVRMRIHATLSAISQQKPGKSLADDASRKMPKGKSTNPFEDEDNLFDNCFDDENQTSSMSDYERQLHQEQQLVYKNQKVEALRLQAEQARANADATKKLENDIEDLNQIMVDLAQLVHSQHEIVDSIEEQVERSAFEVQKANRQLKQAVTSKQAKYPVVAAAVGGVALGGPVGLAAGSVIAGVASAVVGAVAGLWGGRAIRQKTVQENNSTNNE